MWFWMIQPSLACGGLFCATTPAQPVPVVQNAERIAFAITDGYVETHVQVFYEGPPDAFAWVVPVQAGVEVFASNAALFQVLDQQLSPLFQLTTRVEGDCGPVVQLGCASNRINPTDSASNGILDTGDLTVPGVFVADEGQVGPYDFVVLGGVSEDAVVDYLIELGFDVGPSTAEALAPYLDDGGQFLAIRLQKDRDAGDIAPLGFRYPAQAASVPIQLTRVAAAPDMGLQINVFGTTNAVSSNYLHVTLDEAKIDWQTGGSNYFDLVARAVDEAGGHGVVTDFAGPTFALQGMLWSDRSEHTVEQMRSAPDLDHFVDLYTSLALPDNAALVYGFEGYLDYQVADPIQSFATLQHVDLSALTEQLDARVFDGLRRAQAMMDLGRVTRMSTTLDPAEMTVDPVFVLNELAPDVAQLRTAEQVLDCKVSRRNPPTDLILTDGRVYRNNSDRDTPTASDVLRIERWAESGPPEVLVDNTQAVLDAADAPRHACGCTGSALAPSLFWVLAAVIGLRRKR